MRESFHPIIREFHTKIMKRSSFILLSVSLFASQLHAAGGSGNGEGYYTDELKYQTRPDPARETFFGVIGTTGIKARVYPGVVLKMPLPGKRPGLQHGWLQSGRGDEAAVEIKAE